MKKILIAGALLLIVVAGIVVYPYYRVYTISTQLSNVATVSTQKITIKEGAKINELGGILKANGVIDNADDFNYLANYKQKDRVLTMSVIRIEKAKWKTYNDILNNIIVQMNGGKSVVDVQYNNVSSIAEIAGKLTRNIDLDSTEFASYLLSEETRNSVGFSEDAYPTFFIPVKFEVYQDISQEELFEKLKNYYKSFWTTERKQKASSIGYSQSEITILASIVYEEQKVKFDEQAKIAGLYLNRLKKGWLLQADPTVKFALGDPSIKRLLFKHLEVDSPYNTYKYKGLPPGPISFPESQTIDAVLNYEQHDYMYMCAKPEYSGYHNFSKTLSQHNAYAKAYQKWLNSEGIK